MQDLLQERLNTQQGGLGGSSQNPFDDAAALGGSAASAALALQGIVFRSRFTADGVNVRLQTSDFEPCMRPFAI